MNGLEFFRNSVEEGLFRECYRCDPESKKSKTLEIEKSRKHGVKKDITSGEFIG